METWCLPSVGVPVTIEILFALVLVKFDEHSRSAQTDPAVVALYVAPVIHPTLHTGVEALIVAARAWLAP